MKEWQKELLQAKRAEIHRQLQEWMEKTGLSQSGLKVAFSLRFVRDRSLKLPSKEVPLADYPLKTFFTKKRCRATGVSPYLADGIGRFARKYPTVRDLLEAGRASIKASAYSDHQEQMVPERTMQNLEKVLTAAGFELSP